MASVHRDGASWRTRWGVLQNGQYTQHSRSFATRRQAQDYARQMEHAYEIRGVAVPRDCSVAELAADFLAWCTPRQRIATVHGYQAKINYALRHVGSIPARRLTPQQLEAAYTSLLEGGGIGGRKLSKRTVLHVHRCVYRMLKLAARQGRIPSNPAALVEPISVPPVKAKAPSIEQSAALLSVAATREPWSVLLTLALMSGLRRGELCGLRWADLDLEAGWLAVTQTCEQAGRVFQIARVAKTATSARRIALDPGTIDVLRAWRGRYAELLLGLGLANHADALVFADLASGSVLQPYEPLRVSGIAARLARKAGWPRDVQPIHGLRHRHASSLMTLPLRLVADRLGHATVQITANLYQHGDEGDARAAAIAVANTLGKLLVRNRQ
jgi:integrase